MQEEIIKSVADWFSVPVVLVVCVVVVAAALWLAVRTRSPSPLLERAWRLLVGTTSAPDRPAGQLLKEHQELLEFRFRFIPSLRTHRELLRLRKWLVRHNEEIGDIGRCGDFFDIANLSVREKRLPSRKARFALGALVLIAIEIAMVLAIGAMVSGPIVTFRESGTTVILQRTQLKPIAHAGTLRQSQCTDLDAVTDTGLTRTELAAGCDYFSSPEDIARMEKDLPIQRFVLTLGAAFFAAAGIGMLRGLSQAKAARDLLGRLAERAAALAAPTDAPAQRATGTLGVAPPLAADPSAVSARAAPIV